MAEVLRKKFGLNEAVRAEAMSSTFDDAVHHDICVKLVELVDKFNERDNKGRMLGKGKGFTCTKSGTIKPFPMSFLVYVAVNKEAHKEVTFRKGYKSINVEKAKAVLNMCKFFGIYNENHNLSRNDKVVHACCKFYDKVSHKVTDFEKCLAENWRPYKGTPKTMKEITIGLKIDVE